MIAADTKSGRKYLKKLIENHISGQMKIAPEHVRKKVLNLMGKPDSHYLSDFVRLFEQLKAETRSRIYLTYYFMAGHPGCGIKDMIDLRKFVVKKLDLLPEQVQIFTPSPSTFSTLMYFTEKNPFTGEKIFVEKTVSGRQKQKNMITPKRKNYLERRSQKDLA